MKDYSMSLEERKDFVLGYNITDDGQIIVKFAKGKPWNIPYNETNEQLLLDKIKRQVENTFGVEQKLKDKIIKSTVFLTVSLLSDFYFFFNIFLGEDFIYFVSSSCVFTFASLIAGSITFKYISKLKDLRRNKRFLNMEDKINSNIRNNQNALVNVSNKTKKAIKDFPEDKPIFNINSFNYVPYRDLEQIIENVNRNERFGFDYTEQEEVNRAKTRKKIR